MRSVEERRKKVKEEYEKTEQTLTDIAIKINVPYKTVAQDIYYLRKKGEITTRRKRTKITDKEIEEKRQKAKILYEQEEKTMEEIAKEVDVSVATITTYLDCLRERGEILTREKGTKVTQRRIEQRRHKVQGWCNQAEQEGKEVNEDEMAAEFGVSRAIIISDIAYWKKQKERLSHKTEKEEVVDSAQCIQDIVFCIKQYLKTGKFKEAMKFCYQNIKSNEWTEEEKEKLKQLEEQIKLANQKYIALKALRRGEGVQQAMQCSRLPKEEVIRLNQKLQNRMKKETYGEPNK